MAYDNSRIFWKQFPVGTTVYLRKNITGKRLGPREVLKISRDEVKFLLPDGQHSWANLRDLQLAPYTQGLSIYDLEGRLVADYNLEP